MKVFRWTLIAVLLGSCLPVFAGQAGGISVSHFEPLQRLGLRSKDSSGSQKPTGSAPATLSFDAFGQSFELELEANTRFLSPQARSALPANLGIYRGALAGNSASWARIVIYDGMPRGFIWDGKDLYAIEAPDDSLVTTTEPVIYRLADTVVAPGAMMCGAESMSGNGSEIYTKVIGELGAVTAQAPGAVSAIDIGAVGDFEFTSAMGDDAAAVVAITDRMNRVDGIYSQEIGIQINVPEIETFSDSNLDPFTDEIVPGALLSEVATYRRNTPAQRSQGLTHLWTGRDLEGNTVGIAYTDVLCSSNSGAGLSEGSNSPGFDSLVAAHEIGHNFGAPHDGVPGDCESEPQTFIMAPRLTSSREFSQCSKTIMQANAAQASCIAPLPTVDLSVVLAAPATTVLLGAETVLTYDIVNNGSLTATNAAAAIVIPAVLRIESVATTVGSCTQGAGTVSCGLGDVAGLSQNAVTITTTPTAVGSGTLSATVTADVDERSDNDQTSTQITVDPAVDLAVTSVSSLSVAPEQTATLNATLQNLAALDASSATISVAFGTRFRADSASLSIGTCTVTAQQVDCLANIFANLSTATLTIGITALSTGQQDYSVTVSASEAEANSTDNSAVGTVTIANSNSTNNDGGGSGAAGVGFLLLLLMLATTPVVGTRRSQQR